MAVRPDTLETPERGMELLNRETLEAVELDPAEEAPRSAPPPRQAGGPGLRARLEAARRLQPEDGVACQACWQQGRDAAVQILDTVTTQAELRTRVAAARALTPAGLHWLDPWRRGRDAALRVIEEG